MGRPKAVQTSFWGTLGKALLSKTAIVIVALIAQAALLIWLVIDLSQYAAYVYAGFLVLSALVILYVVNRDDNPDFKLVWMVPIAALPVVSEEFDQQHHQGDGPQADGEEDYDGYPSANAFLLLFLSGHGTQSSFCFSFRLLPWSSTT